MAPVTKCSVCENVAILKRPKTGDVLCKDCFYFAFEEEVHHTITAARLLTAGETVAIGASGGKDSTVLAHVLKVLNERYSYGVRLILLSVDEGITGYRDDSLETVKRNQVQYDLPLKIVSYKELYGWTMDDIVKQIGLKNNCTFCGVFRRQALDRGAMMLKVDKIVTGHNADDIAETVIMNVLRGDIARLRRCTAVTTGMDGALPRCKPFKYTYEKEIVMYAYFKKLDYFSTECIYSPNAYRGFARTYIKDLEKIRPSAIIDIIHSGESMSVKKDIRMPVQGTCTRCGYMSSNSVCKACVLLEGLNKGRPRLGIGKEHKERRKMAEEESQNKSDLHHSSPDGLPVLQTSSSGLQTSSSGLQTSSSGLQTSSSGLQTSSSGLQTSSSGLQTSSSGLQTSSSGLQTSSTGLQTSSTGLHTSSSGLQTSSTELQTSSTGLHTSSTGLHTSSTGLQTSSTGLHTSSTGLHTSSTGLHTSSTGLQTSSTGLQTSSTGLQTSSTGLQTSSSGLQTSSTGGSGT